MYRYLVITDQQTAGGFALGGVEVVAVYDDSDLEAVRATVEECMEASDVGLLALNDRYLPLLGTRLTKKIERSVLPLAVVFPDPKRISAEEVESYITSLIRSAIGYRVRLRA